MQTKTLCLALATALSLAAVSATAAPWTFRGSLNDGGEPANGSYDIRVTLLNEAKNASITGPLTLYKVPVKDGQFAVDVDFGIDLANAPAMSLKTEVQQGGSGFVALGEPTRFDAKAALGSVCWDTEGNAGTSPVTNFIGTTDAQPLVLRTRNVPTFRLESSTVLFNGGPITANVIGGSSANFANVFVRGATIAGGGVPAGASEPDFVGDSPNIVWDHYGTVGGGYANWAGDGVGTVSDAPFATIGGGSQNRVQGESGTIGGGLSNRASGRRSTIGGGDQNSASGVGSTIAGGQVNFASGSISTVGGGIFNIASGESSSTSGGLRNTASGSRSTVSGGQFNTASGTESTVSGGESNCAGGDASWAGGSRATVRPSNTPGDGFCTVNSGDANGDEGTFLWSGFFPFDFRSTGPNQFGVRAGGYFFGGPFDTSVAIPAGRFINTSSGAHLTTGGTWTNASSRTLKTAFESVDPLAVLGKVVSLPLSTWTYKDSVEGRHLGPVAEDFKALFGLGGDGESIATVDADGVALAAIQGLNQKLEAENAELVGGQNRLAAENAALKASLQALEVRLSAIEERR